MYNIVVRSGKDADAIEAMIKSFYKGWDIEINTLRGARRLEEAIAELGYILSPRKINILLLGREDQKLAEELVRYTSSHLAAIKIVPRARVRNARLEMLAEEFEIARSIIRLSIKWCSNRDGYMLGANNEECTNLDYYRYDPAYDLFLLFRPSLELINEDLGIKVPDDYLVALRMYGGLHFLYRKEKIFAKLKIPDEGTKIEVIAENTKIDEELKLEKIVALNKEVIKKFEEVSTNYIKQETSSYDYVVVPWSGGKDSTATLLLTMKVVPRDKIKVIFVDTGLEFPLNKEYVEALTRKLELNTEVLYAGIHKEISVKGMPSHDNRWCTAMKIEAISKYVESLARKNKVVVIVGDRDAESERRASRPPTYYKNRVKYVAPIKFWSTIHSQLYLLTREIPLNKLYELGMYRIGCYICPSLRAWEVRTLLRNKDYFKEILENELFKSFLALKKARDALS